MFPQFELQLWLLIRFSGCRTAERRAAEKKHEEMDVRKRHEESVRRLKEIEAQANATKVELERLRAVGLIYLRYTHCTF